MNDFIAIENIHEVLDRKMLLPTVVLWNRLEGRPRTKNFTRALRAEVRDPLWMLCKQWQTGEFKGDDAGSPIFAKVHMATTELTKYQPGDAAVQDFDRSAPLEAIVEQRPFPYSGQQHILSLDIRLLMGRQWLKYLQSAGLSALKPQYLQHAAYRIVEPDPASRSDAFLTAHPAVWQSFSALAGRAMDGANLYFYLKADNLHHAYDGITLANDSDKTTIDDLAGKFVQWYEQLFYQPDQDQNDAWQPQQLEYQFAVSAPKSGAEKVMAAEEYYQGRLDWYNLDVDPNQENLGDGNGDPVEAKSTLSFFPTAIQFEGMPNTRWWTFEEGKTNFGDIKPDTTDINKLLLMEFGLVYANDWFLVPFQLPVGSIANVQGLAVTNVFGERFWVTASGSGSDEDWQRWAMYNLTVKGSDNVRADTSLLLLPTVPKIQEGKPLDELWFVRDEVANMVWGIEKKIPLATGRSKPGNEAGRELFSRLESILDSEIEGGLVAPEIPEASAAIRYQLMQGVPENWIPMIPVHLDNNNREIQLQRASMPRIILGDPNPPEKVKPRTVLLRQGLDQQPPQAYFLHEEEVPRAGVQVTQAYQRTRWNNGQVFCWLGVKKHTGRGEGSSGLAFDRVKPTNERLRRALKPVPK
ncbi:MAG: hypothetical protein A4S08_04395 [Proteobacteria bacterium SG_bin4]|nr:MAG: hypothetical protein A4S08_04395 [Proteobacteria bacterium SG_bin4]